MTDIDESTVVAVAGWVNELGFVTGNGLYDRERAALAELERRGLLDFDPIGPRTIQLNDAGREWLGGQGT